MKKILFLLHLPPPVHGSSMVGQWIKDSVAINSTFDCSYLNLLASNDVHESGKITLSKLYGFLGLICKLITILSKDKPEISYFALTTTGAAFYRDVVLVSILRLWRVKIVYHLHNKGIAKASENGINRCLYRYVFRDAKVIVLAKPLKNDLTTVVDDKQIEVCANGIPGKMNSIDSNQPNETPCILFLSNLIETKGVYILLEALARLKHKKLCFSAVLVGGEGDISENSLCSKLSELNLEKEVHYLGCKYGTEKAHVLSNADIFAFPTYNDCFPLVLLEAMQYSLPVVSTFEGGIPDIVEHGSTGFLVSQKEIQDFADKLELLLTNPVLRTKMGEAGRQKYEAQLRIENFENRMIEILSKYSD